MEIDAANKSVIAYYITIAVIDVAAIAGIVALVITGHPWWSLLPLSAIHTFDGAKKDNAK